MEGMWFVFMLCNADPQRRFRHQKRYAASVGSADSVGFAVKKRPPFFDGLTRGSGYAASEGFVSAGANANLISPRPATLYSTIIG